MKIYCFGNPFLKDDRLPLELVPELQSEFPSIQFIYANSPDEIENESTVNIIDTVDGIEKVELITEIDSICVNKNCSLHDFDLGMTLKIMKKMGSIKAVRIIGIPKKYTKKKALSEVKAMINELKKTNE